MFRFLERHGIPYHYLHTTKENKREGEILDLVQDTDFLVLARYMQVNKMISWVPNHVNYFYNIEKEESRVVHYFVIEIQKLNQQTDFSIFLFEPSSQWIINLKAILVLQCLHIGTLFMQNCWYNWFTNCSVIHGIHDINYYADIIWKFFEELWEGYY